MLPSAFDITISKSAVRPLVRAMDSVISGTPIPNATWAEKEAMLQLKETLMNGEAAQATTDSPPRWTVM